MSQMALPKLIFVLIFLGLVFGANFYYPEMGFQSFAFMSFASVLLLVALIPLRWGLVFTFAYIGLEGFFKVVSNYHPVIHVASDILVLCLCMKVLVETMTRGEMLAVRAPPLILLFFLHFGWILVCLFHPYSLGWMASLAGAKIYLTMVMLYFFGYYQTRSINDIYFFLIPFIIVGFLQTGFGIYQGMMGEQSVLALHPRYAIQLAKYQEYAFRPFGLTNLPGGPAVYLSPLMPMVLFLMFTTRYALLRVALMMFVPLGVFLFLLCQIRASLLKMIIGSVVAFVGGIYTTAKRSKKGGVIVSGSVIAVLASLIFLLPRMADMSKETNAENEQAIERSLTLFELDTVGVSRRGAWARFEKYVQDAPLGAGFSRVGASAGKFSDLHKTDPFFGEKYFFTDNFWLTCLVEIGLPGMLIMTLMIVFILIRGWGSVRAARDSTLKLAALSLWGSLFAIVIGLYGAEGVLYNPESSFFWFFAGVLLKISSLPGAQRNKAW